MENSYARQISPLTMEDKFSKFDMPWISNLRRDDPDAPMILNGQKNENKGAKGPTIANPPSFFENSVKKWEDRFSKSKFRTCAFTVIRHC